MTISDNSDNILKDFDFLSSKFSAHDNSFEKTLNEVQNSKIDERLSKLEEERLKLIHEKLNIENLFSQMKGSKEDQIEILKGKIRQMEKEQEQELEEKGKMLHEIDTLGSKMTGMWQVRLQETKRISGVKEIVLKVKNRLKESNQTNLKLKDEVKKKKGQIEDLIVKEKNSTQIMKRYHKDIESKKKQIVMLNKRLAKMNSEIETKKSSKKKEQRIKTIRKLNSGYIKADLKKKVVNLIEGKARISKKCADSVKKLETRLAKLQDKVGKKMNFPKAKELTKVNWIQYKKNFEEIIKICAKWMGEILGGQEMAWDDHKMFQFELKKHFFGVKQKLANLEIFENKMKLLWAAN